MTYQIKHAKRRNLSSLLKLVGIILLVVLGTLLFSLGRVNAVSTNFLSPFFKAGNYLYDNIQIFPSFFSDKVTLTQENEVLKQKVDQNYLNVLDYETLKAENSRLREELELRPEGDYITAAILAKPPQTLSGSFILDRGTNDNVKVGDEVFVSEKTMIGKISEATGSRSILKLNSFGGAVSQAVLGRTGEPLEMKGAGGGSMEGSVPIDFDIEAGDMIFKNDSLTSLVAVVGAVEENTSSGIKNIFLSIPVDVSKVNLVFIRRVVGE